MSGTTPLRRRHGNPEVLGSARRALSPLALTADPKDVFGAPSGSSSGLFAASPPLQRRDLPPSSPSFLKSPKSKREFEHSPERVQHTRKSSSLGGEADFRAGGLLSPKKRFVPGQDVPLSPLKRRHAGHRVRSDSLSSVGSVGSILEDDLLGSENEADELPELLPRWGNRAERAVVKNTPQRADKGKRKQTDTDDDKVAARAEQRKTTLLRRQAAVPNASASAAASRASVSASRASSLSSYKSASRSRARSRAHTRGLSSISVSKASASAAASSASVQSAASAALASAASVASAAAATATAATTAQASSQLPSDSASAAPSATSSVAPSPSSASASAAMSTPSSTTTNGATLPASSNRAHNLERIVIPSVVVPVVCILVIAAIILCCRRSRNKERQRLVHSPTPSSFGAMGSPREPAYAAAGGFGGGPMFGGKKAGYAGSDAGLVVGPNPNLMSERQRQANESVESFATSPSAIGVAVGEGAYGKGEGPVTVWGRRSLRDVVASGSAAASSVMTSPEEPPVPSRPDRTVSGGTYIAGRQPSIASMRGSIDGPVGYQPGMPRPVYSPERGSITSPTQFEPFTAIGAGAAGAAVAHGIRPVSDAPTEFSQDIHSPSVDPSESYYGGVIGGGTQSDATPGLLSPLSEGTTSGELDDASVNGEGATSDPRSSVYNQPFNLNALGGTADSQAGTDDIFSDPPSAVSSPEVAPVNFNSSSGESEADGTVQGTPTQEQEGSVAEGGTPRAGGAPGQEKWW